MKMHMKIHWLYPQSMVDAVRQTAEPQRGPAVALPQAAQVRPTCFLRRPSSYRCWRADQRCLRISVRCSSRVRKAASVVGGDTLAGPHMAPAASTHFFILGGHPSRVSRVSFLVPHRCRGGAPAAVCSRRRGVPVPADPGRGPTALGRGLGRSGGMATSGVPRGRGVPTGPGGGREAGRRFGVGVGVVAGGGRQPRPKEGWAGRGVGKPAKGRVRAVQVGGEEFACPSFQSRLCLRTRGGPFC